MPVQGTQACRRDSNDGIAGAKSISDGITADSLCFTEQVMLQDKVQTACQKAMIDRRSCMHLVTGNNDTKFCFRYR